MNNRSSVDSIVELVIALVFAITAGIVIHYYSRGRDWLLYATDDPDLYALTDREHTLFAVSAWAFPAESALIMAGFTALAVTAAPGFAIGAAIFGVVLIGSIALLAAREEGVGVPDDDEFYDLWVEDE